MESNRSNATVIKDTEFDSIWNQDFLLRRLLDQSDVISLQQDAPDVFLEVCLENMHQMFGNLLERVNKSRIILINYWSFCMISNLDVELFNIV